MDARADTREAIDPRGCCEAEEGGGRMTDPTRDVDGFASGSGESGCELKERARGTWLTESRLGPLPLGLLGPVGLWASLEGPVWLLASRGGPLGLLGSLRRPLGLLGSLGAPVGLFDSLGAPEGLLGSLGTLVRLMTKGTLVRLSISFSSDSTERVEPTDWMPHWLPRRSACRRRCRVHYSDPPQT